MTAIPLKDSKICDMRLLEGLSSQERSRIHVPSVDLLDNPFGVDRQLEDLRQQQLQIQKPYIIHADNEKSSKKLRNEHQASKKHGKRIDAVSVRSKLVQSIIRDVLGNNSDYSLPPVLLEPDIKREVKKRYFPDYEKEHCVDVPVSFGHRPSSACKTVNSFDLSVSSSVASKSMKRNSHHLISSNVFKLILYTPAASSLIPMQQTPTDTKFVFASPEIHYPTTSSLDELEEAKKDYWCYNNIPDRIPSHELKQSALLDPISIHDNDNDDDNALTDKLKARQESFNKRAAGTYSTFIMCEDKKNMDLHESLMRSDASYKKKYCMEQDVKSRKERKMKEAVMSPRSKGIDCEVRDILKRSKKRDDDMWRLTLLTSKKEKLAAVDRQVERIMRGSSKTSNDDERVVKLPT